ncbi:hypothetical protein GM658_12490 [Pseudoduganella eburnea]|uniref:Uncharacterized protein n=1 Tax=Massilia eburnea TaxID=1776165 RepID=A0A6L6QGS8_9BURK|nr:hypothetical protein [Massilia eburnea]MTW11415.1 hypothetical protein [Massilia eburnea]
MGAVLLVDGVTFVEQSGLRLVGPVQSQKYASSHLVPKAKQEFQARLANWRKVVKRSVGAGGASQYCAGWAKLYVHLRTSEAAPGDEQLAEKIRPLSPLVASDELDGWLVEAAWRTLGDANERQALKALYIYQWPVDQVRRFLRGVRGPHVPLVIAKAERNLQAVLEKLGSVEVIRNNIA